MDTQQRLVSCQRFDFISSLVSILGKLLEVSEIPWIKPEMNDHTLQNVKKALVAHEEQLNTAEKHDNGRFTDNHTRQRRARSTSSVIAKYLLTALVSLPTLLFAYSTLYPDRFQLHSCLGKTSKSVEQRVTRILSSTPLIGWSLSRSLLLQLS